MTDKDLIHDLSVRLAGASEVLSKVAEKDAIVREVLLLRQLIWSIASKADKDPVETCRKYLRWV